MNGMIRVGGIGECTQGSSSESVIHACKHPCYVRRIHPAKSYPPQDERYLWVEDDNDLFLNIIDPPEQLLFKTESMKKVLSFGKSRPRILVHCNEGKSRSVSLAILLWSVLGDGHDTFDEAKRQFELAHPDLPHTPQRGIQRFLAKHWDELRWP